MKPLIIYLVMDQDDRLYSAHLSLNKAIESNIYWAGKLHRDDIYIKSCDEDEYIFKEDKNDA